MASGQAIIRDPTMFDQADYVVMESFMGHNRKDYQNEDQLADVVNHHRHGGNVIIPAIGDAVRTNLSLSRLNRYGRMPQVGLP